MAVVTLGHRTMCLNVTERHVEAHFRFSHAFLLTHARDFRDVRAHRGYEPRD